MDESQNVKIDSLTKFLMLSVAGLIDSIQFLLTFIPVLGQVLSFFLAAFALFVFGVWFFLKGVNYFSGKKSGTKIASLIATSVIELIPLVHALPATTIGVASVIYASRQEDKEKSIKSVPAAPYRGVGRPANDNEEFEEEEREAA